MVLNFNILNYNTYFILNINNIKYNNKPYYINTKLYVKYLKLIFFNKF